jgi:hypothetical protein
MPHEVLPREAAGAAARLEVQVRLASRLLPLLFSCTAAVPLCRASTLLTLASASAQSRLGLPSVPWHLLLRRVPATQGQTAGTWPAKPAVGGRQRRPCRSRCTAGWRADTGSHAHVAGDLAGVRARLLQGHAQVQAGRRGSRAVSAQRARQRACSHARWTGRRGDIQRALQALHATGGLKNTAPLNMQPQTILQSVAESHNNSEEHPSPDEPQK